MLKGTDGGSVELNHNGSKKFETTASGIDVTGHTETDTLNVSGLSTFTGDVSFASTITFGDDDQIIMGDGSDLKLYHDGSNSYIEDTGTGALIMKGSTLRFRSTDNEKIINAHQNGSVDLFYDDSKKFETTGIGISVLSGTGLTATIAGPSNLILDPGTVGDNTGIVRIKGDLFVDGSTTQINSTSLEIADFIVGIASTATTDLLTDGAGIKIGPDNTFLYEHNSGTNPSLKSSENLNVASGKGYQVNQVEVLNATTLGSNVVNSSLTSVGTLNGLDVNGHTELDTLNVSGISTFQSHVELGDDDELRIGDNKDLRLYHDGSNSYVADNGSGSLILASTFGGVLIRKHNVNETMAGFNPDSSVDLYFNGDKKFETTGAGVTVTGTTFSNQLNVSGVSTFHDTVTATEITAPTGSTLEISGGSSDASANAKITFPQNDSAEFKIEGAYGGSANLRIDSMTSGNVILRTGNSSQNATITLQPNVIDLKGHTEIDTLNISGLSTFKVMFIS